MKKVINLTIAAGLFAVSGGVMAQCSLANLSAWSANQNPANLLDVTLGAAMGPGDCGMELEVQEQTNGPTRHWVQDDSPVAETRYRAAFCMNPNDIAIPANSSGAAERRLKFHIASCGSVQDLGCFRFDNLMLKLSNIGTDAGAGKDYEILGMVRDDNVAGVNRRHIFHADVPDTGAFRVEYDLNYAAATPYLKMWINATNENDPTVVDLQGIALPAGAQGVNLVRLGQMGKHQTIPAGSTYSFDAFESRRQTFIGGGAAACN